MGFTYTDASKKYLGNTSATAWSHVCRAAEAKGWKSFPALAQMRQYGYTNMLSELSVECDMIAKLKVNGIILSSVKELKKAADAADEILVLEN